MKTSLRIFLVSLVVILAFAVAFITVPQLLQSPRTAGNTTPLLFLGNQNLAPIVYLDGSIPAGVDIDIVNALAPHMSQPVEIRAMNWTEAQALVARGDADALIQINPTEARKKLYDFSDPLLESHFSIFTRTDRTGISGLSGLHGLRIGVESGGLPQQLLGKDPDNNLIIIPDFIQAFRQLNEGSLDAVVVDYRVGSYVLAQNNIKNIKVIGEPIESSTSSFAVKKGNTQLLNEINLALHTIKSDGTYQKIIDKWQPTEAVFETQQQIADRNYRITISILLLLFLVAVIWIVTIKKDLTKRKEAEEKLRDQYSTLRGIINSADAHIFSVDCEYRYTSFNQSHAGIMKKLYGAEIEPGHSLLTYMTVPEDRETARLHLDRALAGEQLVEEAYSGEGTSRKFVRVSHSPIRTEGEIIGVAVLAQDITDRKRAEEDLRELYVDLERRVVERTSELSQREHELTVALTEKEVLLSEIHHRVKNNLTAFISMLSLEGSTEESPEGKALKLDLQNRARSMALIHETLYKTNTYDEVDMGIYLTTLLEHIGNSFQKTRPVKIVVDAHGVMLDIPRATPAGLIINELVTNSYKYAFPESFDVPAARGAQPTITIAFSKTDGSYEMTVSDNGVGLPPGFDLAKTQTLGLKLVNFLAKHQMRAKIEVNLEKGTEFLFRFRE